MNKKFWRVEISNPQERQGTKDIPTADQHDPAVQKLEGTTVLLDRETARLVLTVYRNREATREIRRKEKYRIETRRMH